MPRQERTTRCWPDEVVRDATKRSIEQVCLDEDMIGSKGVGALVERSDMTNLCLATPG